MGTTPTTDPCRYFENPFRPHEPPVAPRAPRRAALTITYRLGRIPPASAIRDDAYSALAIVVQLVPDAAIAATIQYHLPRPERIDTVRLAAFTRPRPGFPISPRSLRLTHASVAVGLRNRDGRRPLHPGATSRALGLSSAHGTARHRPRHAGGRRRPENGTASA